MLQAPSKEVASPISAVPASPAASLATTRHLAAAVALNNVESLKGLVSEKNVNTSHPEHQQGAHLLMLAAGLPNDGGKDKATQKVVRFLLSKGADPSALDSQGRSPAQIATQAGNLGVAQILLTAQQACDPQMLGLTTIPGNLPEDLFVKQVLPILPTDAMQKLRGCNHHLKSLVDAEIAPVRRFFRDYMSMDAQRLASKLPTAQVDFSHSAIHNGATLLMRTAGTRTLRGHDYLAQEVARVLIAKGANPRARDGLGRSPAQLAVTAGNHGLAKLLQAAAQDPAAAKARYAPDLLLNAAEGSAQP